ncbi:hypothetical protein SAMN05421749_103427 [Acinetobacter marinus]|uniref:Uncharacterized protein n=1 Tax=Acinetobacter marinus TaxID=281375 RepID=A0A1G6JT02_9GAMM|nr:hypothetical protein [Acinetobacter marinus]SDC21136.1 hypothetical protein SAMN05421749_103427 [Acinetobacter marinus]
MYITKDHVTFNFTHLDILATPSISVLKKRKQSQRSKALGYSLLFLTVLLSCLATAYAESVPQFFAPLTTSSHSNSKNSIKMDTASDQFENSMYLEKNQRYAGEDQPIIEESRLDNSFYQDDGIRIYNNTWYSMDDLSEAYKNAQTSQVTMSDLSISLGYGMEFDVKQNQSVGYEYTSSFPHDRGQAVRVFWKVAF